MATEATLTTTTMAGLHDFVVETVFQRLESRGGKAVDLGAGSGLFAKRMKELGWNAMGADKNVDAFKAALPFQEIDLNDREFSKQLGECCFTMVAGIEVIEHVEAPINLLRNARRLLKPGGRIVLTTPNVDSVPARLKFLLTEKIRMMDEVSEPTHVSPVFWDLLRRKFVPAADLEIEQHYLYPPDSFIATRPRYAWIVKTLSPFVGGECKLGDNHVLVLRARTNGHV